MEEVRSWLCNNGYDKYFQNEDNGPKHHAENVIWRLGRHNDLMQALINMIRTGNEPTYLSCEGFTYNDLRKKFGMEPVGVLLTIVWLREVPSEARAGLEYGIR